MSCIELVNGKQERCFFTREVIQPKEPRFEICANSNFRNMIVKKDEISDILDKIEGTISTGTVHQTEGAKIKKYEEVPCSSCDKTKSRLCEIIGTSYARYICSECVRSIRKISHEFIENMDKYYACWEPEIRTCIKMVHSERNLTDSITGEKIPEDEPIIECGFDQYKTHVRLSNAGKLEDIIDNSNYPYSGTRRCIVGGELCTSNYKAELSGQSGVCSEHSDMFIDKINEMMNKNSDLVRFII